MLTREVSLFTGMKFGEERLYNATIREEVLEDELAVLEAGFTGVIGHRKIMMRRVIKIGTLDKPSEQVVRKLTRTDWELLDQAMVKMDEERALESGLATPEKGDDGGRDEPGGETSGAA